MKIAVAIDGSENALRAAKHAIYIAKHFPKGQVEIIFVADHGKTKDEYLLSQSADSLALTREQKFKPIVDYAKEQGVQTTTTLLKGNPSAEIIRYVNERDVEQLIIGSRGLNSFQEMLVGSVSHKVMKHVKCPVTIVK